jgi:hypothetical protein
VASGQASPAAPRATVLGGVGNDFGWIGAQGTVHVRPHLAVYAGLGYTPAIDRGDPSGIAGAGGLRGFFGGPRHLKFVELGVTQLVVETSVTPLAGVEGRRLYGPGVQAGYQYVSGGGLSILFSLGLGYVLAEPVTGSRIQPQLGLGIGYTFRVRP